MADSQKKRRHDRRSFLGSSAMAGAAALGAGAFWSIENAEAATGNASNVIYRPPGAGGATRSIGAVFDESIRVTDYWNGKGDLSSAIRASISRADQGGTVYFPAGHYVINDHIVIRKKITLIGNHDAVLEVGAENKGSLTFSNSFRVEGMTFQNFPGKVLKFEPLPDGSDASIEIVNCRFFDNGDYCLSVADSLPCRLNRVSIVNNLVERCAEGGFSVNAPVENVIVAENHIKDTPNTQTGGGRAILIGKGKNEEKTKNVVVTNNTVDGLSSGKDKECQAIKVWASLAVIKGNVLKGMARNQGADHEMIYLKGLETVIEGNVVDAAGCTGDAAILIKNREFSRRNIVANNIIYDHSEHPGTVAMDVAGSVAVTGNIIENTRSGIVVWNKKGNPEKETVIAGNRVSIAKEKGNAFRARQINGAIVTGNYFNSPCDDAPGIEIKKAGQLEFCNNIVRQAGGNRDGRSLDINIITEGATISNNDFWSNATIALKDVQGRITITGNRIQDHPDTIFPRSEPFFLVNSIAASTSSLFFSGNELETAGHNWGSMFGGFTHFRIDHNDIRSTASGTIDLFEGFLISPDAPQGAETCLIAGNAFHAASSRIRNAFIRVAQGNIRIFELRNNFFSGQGRIVEGSDKLKIGRWKAVDNSLVHARSIPAPPGAKRIIDRRND